MDTWVVPTSSFIEMSSARGRKGLREKPTYGTTLLGMQKDPAASSSGTATEPDFLPESQSQGRSPHTTHQSMPPPPPYVPPPQYVHFLSCCPWTYCSC
ncbi:hypothetical protein HID58_006763 [Brassica napus]|uniref:Uncharacterized protein n=2 Tax=Brassica napus TaxID=3708 RepID=A0ABQ8ECE0_BRANA|nr:hypothetical protein HID58_006763 [Brassica napus]